MILRDVLDFSAIEAADVLDLTVSAVNSALHRARTALSQDYQRQEAQPYDEQTQSLLNLFMKAWESADVEGLVALLKEDAMLAMPPSPSWYRGREAISLFAATTVFADDGMFGGKAVDRWRLVRTNANDQPAYAIYQHTEAHEYQAFGMHVLLFEGGQLSQIISFIDSSLPPLFALPKLLK